MSHVIGKGDCRNCPVQHHSIFSDIPKERLMHASSCVKPLVSTFAANETIYHQESPAHNAYTLRNGLVKLVKALPNGKNQIVRVLRHGDLFGFDGLADEHYNQTAIPLTDVEICILPLRPLLELKKQTPEIEQAMMKRWIQHLREAEDMMVELGAKKANERLASFLLRWCDTEAKQSWIELPLSRSEIGELLGLTIETVSRFFSEWKRQGYIHEQRGNIQMVDADGLKQTIGENI